MGFQAVLDANVLLPAPLRDTLLRLAEASSPSLVVVRGRIGKGSIRHIVSGQFACFRSDWTHERGSPATPRRPVAACATHARTRTSRTPLGTSPGCRGAFASRLSRSSGRASRAHRPARLPPLPHRSWHRPGRATRPWSYRDRTIPPCRSKRANAEGCTGRRGGPGARRTSRRDSDSRLSLIHISEP